MSGIQFAATELISQLTAGAPFRTVLEHGDASVVIYAPKQVDKQSAHAQAEIYVVISGRGRMLIGWQDVAFTAGDLLYVDAGIKHRFEDFGADLAVWAVFFGPSLVGKHTFHQSTISGDATISQDKDTFLAKWSSTGGTGLAGVGFPRPGHIAFARAPGEVGGWPGFVEYRWDNDHLMARWTLPTALHGAIAGGYAALTEGDGPGFAGRFRIQYQDATGADFGPCYDLTITGSGPVRTLEWQTSGTTAFVGVGIVVDDALVAAWAPNGSALEVVDYELPVAGGPLLMAGRLIRLGESVIESEDVTLKAIS